MTFQDLPYDPLGPVRESHRRARRVIIWLSYILVVQPGCSRKPFCCTPLCGKPLGVNVFQSVVTTLGLGDVLNTRLRNLFQRFQGNAVSRRQ